MTLGDRIVIMKDGVIQQIGTPQEVFDHPSNLFVAGFIGVPQMNFYDAELALERDGRYVVHMENVQIIPSEVKQERLRSAGATSQPITLGVRPEHIALLGDGDNMFHGVVEVTEMMGSVVHLHVNACGRDSIIVAQTANLEGPTPVTAKVGNAISFIFGGNVIHLFSKETGRNLEYSEHA